MQVRAYGTDDPGGRHAVAVVSAYFQAEQLHAARGRLCRVFAVGALAAWALYRLTPFLTAVDFGCALALLGGGTTALGVAEWRAKRRLAILLAPPDA